MNSVISFISKVWNETLSCIFLFFNNTNWCVYVLYNHIQVDYMFFFPRNFIRSWVVCYYRLALFEWLFWSYIRWHAYLNIVNYKYILIVRHLQNAFKVCPSRVTIEWLLFWRIVDCYHGCVVLVICPCGTTCIPVWMYTYHPLSTYRITTRTIYLEH